LKKRWRGYHQNEIGQCHSSQNEDLCFQSCVTAGIDGFNLEDAARLETNIAAILQLVEQEDVIITYHGEPKTVLKQFTEEDLEDYILVHYPEFTAQREAACADEAAGRVIDIDTLIKDEVISRFQ
jgi:hypothetical protein